MFLGDVKTKNMLHKIVLVPIERHSSVSNCKLCFVAMLLDKTEVSLTLSVCFVLLLVWKKVQKLRD